MLLTVPLTPLLILLHANGPMVPSIHVEHPHGAHYFWIWFCKGLVFVAIWGGKLAEDNISVSSPCVNLTFK